MNKEDIEILLAVLVCCLGLFSPILLVFGAIILYVFYVMVHK